MEIETGYVEWWACKAAEHKQCVQEFTVYHAEDIKIDMTSNFPPFILRVLIAVDESNFGLFL